MTLYTVNKFMRWLLVSN